MPQQAETILRAPQKNVMKSVKGRKRKGHKRIALIVYVILSATRAEVFLRVDRGGAAQQQQLNNP